MQEYRDNKANIDASLLGTASSVVMRIRTEYWIRLILRI